VHVVRLEIVYEGIRSAVLLRDLSVDSHLELVAQFAQRKANVAFVVLARNTRCLMKLI